MDVPNDIPKEFRVVYENGYTTESTIDAMNAERLRPDLGGGVFFPDSRSVVSALAMKLERILKPEEGTEERTFFDMGREAYRKA
ncbi:MAG: hypothetical protein KKH88_04125 [Nanoarchaeota archaeon]|nr:hypothetical protein [Nanoarchaeota archaeon]